MKAEQAGRTAAETLFSKRWEELHAEFVGAGADPGHITDELLVFLYFAGYTAVHIALFDLEPLKDRVQLGYSLAWDDFVHARSRTAGGIAPGRIRRYTAGLRESNGKTAESMARLLCGFVGSGSRRLMALAARVFDEQIMRTMTALRDLREKGIE